MNNDHERHRDTRWKMTPYEADTCIRIPDLPVFFISVFFFWQVERHHQTGEKEIDFPDGTRKTILPSGREISEFPDGVTVVEYPEVRQDLCGGRGGGAAIMQLMHPSFPQLTRRQTWCTPRSEPVYT